VIGALLLVALAVAGVLAYRWSQEQYYVSSSGDNVAIYQGVRLDLPGVSLSHEYETTDVAVADLPDYNAGQVADGMAADDLTDARSIVARLDELAAECARSTSETSQCAGAGPATPSPTAEPSRRDQPADGAGSGGAR
jgi:protein phosphatase